MYRSAFIATLTAILLPFAGSSQTLTELTVVPQDGTVLGSIADVDVDPLGRILALDEQAQFVYVFDEQGDLQMTLGGEGQGPGEIAVSVEVEAGPSGQVMVADVRNRRLTLWAPDGSLVTSRRLDSLFGTGSAWAHELLWTPVGLFVKMAAFGSDAPMGIYSVPVDLQGDGRQVSTVPRGEGAVTCAFCTIAMDQDGRVFATAEDTIYSIYSLDAQGAVTGEWSRADLPAVRRTQEDIERIRARGSGASNLPIGQVLLRFGPHSIDIDAHGRVRAAPRVPEGRPGFFDVFSPDGDLLRTIQMDVPVKSFRIRGDRLVAASESPAWEPVVRVYQIGG